MLIFGGVCFFGNHPPRKTSTNGFCWLSWIGNGRNFSNIMEPIHYKMLCWRYQDIIEDNLKYITLQGGPPTRYNLGYNPSYLIIRPFIGVITSFITGRGPKTPNLRRYDWKTSVISHFPSFWRLRHRRSTKILSTKHSPNQTMILPTYPWKIPWTFHQKFMKEFLFL